MLCKVCGSSVTQILYTAATDYITGQPFRVWECSGCGVAFTEIFTHDLSPYYPARYRRYTPAILTILKTLYRARTERWGRHFAQPGIAFEMGCGDGFMLDSLREQGWQVVGSERSPAMLVVARDQFHIPVFAGEPDALRPSPTFDMIILFQVLEHLPDPVKTLASLQKRLKPDGKLIIGVPNRDSWQARFGRDRWFHLDVPRHLFHFSPASLEIALNQAGLKTERLRFASPEHDPYGWVQTVLNRLDKRPNRLTRFLMRMNAPAPASLLQLLLGGLIGIVSLPVSWLSWQAGKGAIIEVIARRTDLP